MFKSTAKHRCRCFSVESSSFLYGLRREAPSTERVLLERLLNVLSRAAAKKSDRNNPQRLWSESEKPDWWDSVSKHKWKNPREHPKDNKNVLKDKIETLKRELPHKGQMTPELRKELELHQNSKKVDLELKSDFEAVIAKASGLHFMLDKVSKKLGQSKVISEKIATYIKEIKNCLDVCHKTVCTMHGRVEQGEKRKSSLWHQMGVSKRQEAQSSDALPYEDLESDCLVLEWEDEAEADTSSTAPLDASDIADILTDSDVVEMIKHESEESKVLHAIFSPQVIAPQHHSPQQAHAVQVQEQDNRLMTIQYESSVSQPLPRGTVPETVQVMDLSQGKSVAVSIEVSPTPLRKQRSVADSTDSQAPRHAVRSPYQRSDMTEPIVIEDDEDAQSVHVRRIEAAATTGKQLRDRHSPYDRPKSLVPYKRGSYEFYSDASEKRSRKSQPYPGSPAEFVPVGTAWTNVVPEARSPSVSSDLDGDDLVEDGEGMTVRAQDIEDILEESTGSPTVTMYTGANAHSDMEQLADKTKTLSCDDLSASVTDCVIGGPSAGQQLVHGQQFQQQRSQFLLSDSSIFTRLPMTYRSFSSSAAATVAAPAPLERRLLSNGQLMSEPLLRNVVFKSEEGRPQAVNSSVLFRNPRASSVAVVSEDTRPSVKLDSGQGPSQGQGLGYPAVARSPTATVIMPQVVSRASDDSGRANKSLSQAIADYGGQLGPL